uniref:Uncharacterized protein n=1 Tax=Lepeophtheirus salmonis TaxID=72036 RepID=A0A0K2TZL1_LEPSM
MVLEDLVVDVSIDFLVDLEEEGRHHTAVEHHDAEDHDLS